MTPQAQRIACAEMEGIAKHERVWNFHYWTTDTDIVTSSGWASEQLAGRELEAVSKQGFTTSEVYSTVRDTNLPDYLNDANAALRLCGVIIKRGGWYKIEPSIDGGFDVTIWPNRFKPKSILVTNKSLSIAIVTAALRATGRDSTGEGR